MQVRTILLVLLTILSNIVWTQDKVEKVSIVQNPEHHVWVEYTVDLKGNCNTPLTYTIHKTGTVKENMVLKWTFKYMPCGKSTPQVYRESFMLPKGSDNQTKEIKLKTLMVLNGFDKGSIVSTNVHTPQFSINGPAGNVMEGDAFDLNVQSDNNKQGVKWIWAKGSPSNIIGSGTSITQALSSTTKFYVCAEVEGFRSSFKEYTVNVTKRPDPPSDFTIKGKSEITDLEKVQLSVQTRSTDDDVHWVWMANNQKLGEGLALTHKPTRSTTYTLHSEYYGKRSQAKIFHVKVNILPEPPSGFSILGPNKMNDGDKVWLRVGNGGNDQDVEWVWANSIDGTEEFGDSIFIAPGESVTYKLYANLNGKKSAPKSKFIEVVQKAVAPTILGEFKRCISSSVASTFQLKGGKLGTGSIIWSWYEGTCGSGRLIHSGSTLTVKPGKTTSYYVQPNNNPQVCQSFTVEVGSLPEIPEKIVAPAVVCAGATIELEAIGKKDNSTVWNWYAQDISGGAKTHKGEGSKITDDVNTSRRYTISAKNQYCQTDAAQLFIVHVKEQSVAPSDVFATPVKGKKHTLSAWGGQLAFGSNWVWYKDGTSSAPLGYGSEINYRASKRNHILVRAEGECDTTNIKYLDFDYKKVRSRFIFINAGLSSNTFQSEVTNYSGVLTIGSNRIYLRVKAPISDIVSSGGEYSTGFGSGLITDNNKITNYPANTNTYYKFNGQALNACYGISGGFLFGGNVLKIYTGAGYGKRDLYWEADIYAYGSNVKLGTAKAKNSKASIKGPAAEAGVFLKLGGLNISGGMSMIVGAEEQYKDAFIGIGINFKRKSK